MECTYIKKQFLCICETQLELGILYFYLLDMINLS